MFDNQEFSNTILEYAIIFLFHLKCLLNDRKSVIDKGLSSCDAVFQDFFHCLLQPLNLIKTKYRVSKILENVHLICTQNISNFENVHLIMYQKNYEKIESTIIDYVSKVCLGNFHKLMQNKSKYSINLLKKKRYAKMHALGNAKKKKVTEIIFLWANAKSDDEKLVSKHFYLWQ